MAVELIKVPDLGGAESVEVIEVSVAVGDTVEVEDSIVVLETDKASMDVPSPVAGKVVSVKVSEGDALSEGDLLIEVEAGGAAASEAPAEETAPAEESVEAVEEQPAAASQPAAAPSQPAADMPLIVPDIGTDEAVEIIEVSVAAGDQLAEGETLLVLETDKATVEMPAPADGTLLSLSVNEGDKIKTGDQIGVMQAVGGSAEAAPESAPQAPAAAEAEQPAEPAPAQTQAATEMPVMVPDVGTEEAVEIIEVSVAAGEQVSEGDTLLVLETDKATVEMPAPADGTLVSLSVNEGDKIKTGDQIGVMKAEGSATPAPAPAQEASAPAQKPSAPAAPAATSSASEAPAASHADVYAGPAVRQMARKLGVDLNKVKATGPRNRIVKEDVELFVREGLASGGGKGAATGSGIPAIPEVDFSKFGEIEQIPLTKIQKVTAANMTRNWLNVPHVTQFDDADITDMEDFRKSLKAEGEKRGIKLTPVAFLLKACASALVANPEFNRAISADGESFIQKHYVNIGMAVDTPRGLMVPVMRDVDKKGLWDIAQEMGELVAKTRDGKLTPAEMQGGCFTISSLGVMGGKGFTPIVSAPEVAILGVSKSQTQPVWNGSEFVPRMMLPLSLSYDHRAINGADCGRFFTYLVNVLSDIRRLSL